MNKHQWIGFFRAFADELIATLDKTSKTPEQKANGLNKKIASKRENSINIILKDANRNCWSNEELLNNILLVTYASYIVMLEYRNKVWRYDYMAFSRRIGELWEPFCKLTFAYPINKLSIIDPPKFENVQNNIQQNAIDFINKLKIDTETKKQLIDYYNIPWSLVDSGGIKLSLDLHFKQNGIHYNCDFKSGFSSNEKGNTNRLLLVASIYNSLGEIEKTLLFVRQKEDENNHYLQTLKNSPYWTVYCSNDCYDAMKMFTGFDLRKWLDNNVDWVNDIDAEFKKHLTENDLLKYLTW